MLSKLLQYIRFGIVRKLSNDCGLVRIILWLATLNLLEVMFTCWPEDTTYIILPTL